MTDCEKFEEVNAGARSLDAEDDDMFVSYLLSEDQDTGLQRLVATAMGESLEVSEQLTRLFLPTDAVLVDTGSAPNGNAIQFWESDWLAEQLRNDEAIWGTYAPGTVYVQYVADDVDEPGSDNVAYVEISVPAAEYNEGTDVGRAAVSRDGQGLDPESDRLVITDDDREIHIAVSSKTFADETVYFAAKE